MTEQRTNTFAVLGATGNTGKVVAETLLAAGHKVRILVRDAKKAEALKAKGAEVLEGEVQDANALAKTFRGTDGAYVLIPPAMSSPNPLATADEAVEALRQALTESPVKHVVLLSSVGAQHPAGTGPVVGVHRAEQMLKALPNTVSTFLRPAYFFENTLAYLQAMKSDGVFPTFMGAQTEFPSIATADIGAFAAKALLDSPSSTRVWELEGPEKITGERVAAAFGQAFGREVKALELPSDSFLAAATQAGLPKPMAELYAEMNAGAAKGLMAYDGSGPHFQGKVSIEAFAKNFA